MMLCLQLMLIDLSANDTPGDWPRWHILITYTRRLRCFQSNHITVSPSRPSFNISACPSEKNESNAK